jgi:flagellar FliL protein
MAKETKERETAAEEPRAGLLENKVVVLGVLVVVQALLAVGLTQFVIVPRLGTAAQTAGTATATTPASTVADVGVLVSLNDVIVTLQGDAKLPRYLRARVDVEVADQATADLVTARLPQLRDTVIMILSAKTPVEIQRPEGKQALRDELQRRLSEKLPPETLRAVYFSDLVIQ